MKRTNVYFTEKQLERLHAQAEREGVAMAEVIRRAVEIYLAWNDPTYAPPPQLSRVGFFGGSRLRRTLIRRGEGGGDEWSGPLWSPA